MEPKQPVDRRRATMLAVVLTILALGGFVFFFTLISGGWFIYFVLIVLAMVAFGGLHYLLWGRLMMRETVGEREDAAQQAKAELKEWDLPEPERPRHR
jgi:fatty acid desaturase